jgi:hypothetical protein
VAWSRLLQSTTSDMHYSTTSSSPI